MSRLQLLHHLPDEALMVSETGRLIEEEALPLGQGDQDIDHESAEEEGAKEAEDGEAEEVYGWRQLHGLST